MRERSYRCPVPECQQHYATRYNVRRHISTAHPGFVLNECPRCHRVMSSRQNLKQHLAIHTGDRPYQCQFCLLFFRQSSQLSLHRRQHYLEVREMPVIKVVTMQLTALINSTDVLTKSEESPQTSQPTVKLPELSQERQTLKSKLGAIW